MKHLIAPGMIILLINASTLLAVDGHKVAYFGGTLARFNAVGRRIEGRLDLSGAHRLVFISAEGADAAQSLEIDYKDIRDLEFGQKVGRRAQLVAGTTVLLGPIGLLSLAFRSRHHFLTVAYANDGGNVEVCIFELGKSAVRATLAAVEARSGVAIEYQDNEARQWSR
jgi:hypothetical protein